MIKNQAFMFFVKVYHGICMIELIKIFKPSVKIVGSTWVSEMGTFRISTAAISL
jgi:hypothetical protein